MTAVARVQPGWAGRGEGGPRPRDAGFTLIEVLTVAVIVGVLAAIALPVFLNQRGRAHDAATKQDLTELAKAITAAFVESPSPPSVEVVNGHYRVGGEDIAAVSSGVVFTAGSGAVDTTSWTATAWCLGLTHPDGSQRDYRFSAQQGLQAGTCSSPTAP